MTVPAIFAQRIDLLVALGVLSSRGKNLGVRPKISFSLTTSQNAQQLKSTATISKSNPCLLLSHYRAQTVRNHDIDDHGPQPKGGYNDIPPIQVRLVLQGNESIQSIDQPTNACLPHRGRARHVDTLDTGTSLSPSTHCMHFLSNTFYLQRRREQSRGRFLPIAGTFPP